jgi:hypothetical protein
MMGLIEITMWVVRVYRIERDYMDEPKETLPTFEDAYRAFLKAGWQMVELWDEEKIKKYPKCLPSLDEFMAEMGDMFGEFWHA